MTAIKIIILTIKLTATNAYHYFRIFYLAALLQKKLNIFGY
jgi:hypothetical protein